MKANKPTKEQIKDEKKKRQKQIDNGKIVKK